MLHIQDNKAYLKVLMYKGFVENVAKGPVSEMLIKVLGARFWVLGH
jgi:hypothetical protein